MLRYIAILTILTSASLTAEVTSDPVIAAKEFYRNHANFHCTDPTAIRDLITPRFYKDLKSEYDMNLKGEVGFMDAVPWTDAQDGEIHPPITFTCVSNSGKNAEVKMRYIFFIDKNRSWPQTVILKLESDPTSSKWLISDLITPRSGSLVDCIEKYHEKYP
jgi:hypothetical protein